MVGAYLPELISKFCCNCKFSSSETFYSPEELLGMILSKARDFAQEYSRQPVKEAVITVPPFFNQAERRAVLNAAELAGIKVLQLINSNTAGKPLFLLITTVVVNICFAP